MQNVLDTRSIKMNFNFLNFGMQKLFFHNPAASAVIMF